jgi:hypothetical protein
MPLTIGEAKEIADQIFESRTEQIEFLRFQARLTAQVWISKSIDEMLAGMIREEGEVFDEFVRSLEGHIFEARIFHEEIVSLLRIESPSIVFGGVILAAARAIEILARELLEVQGDSSPSLRSRGGLRQNFKELEKRGVTLPEESQRDLNWLRSERNSYVHGLLDEWTCEASGETRPTWDFSSAWKAIESAGAVARDLELLWETQLPVNSPIKPASAL